MKTLRDRFGRNVIVPAGIALLLLIGCAPGRIQTRVQTPAKALPKVNVGSITAKSAPYRIEWQGTGGVFVEEASAQKPARRIPMDYLFAQGGPLGYSKHLAWFLARDTDRFSILWLYLNDTGADFGSWCYQYPSNQLTFQKFTGNYHFTPPATAPPPNPRADIVLQPPLRYTGPDFTFRGWTRTGGTLDHLKLSGVTGSAWGPGATESGERRRTLSKLRVVPLHQVVVGEVNGWSNSGWQELHCLAFDASNDPYYLILYSNTTEGFVVDIKRAQNFSADVGECIRFAADASQTAQKTP